MRKKSWKAISRSRRSRRFSQYFILGFQLSRHLRWRLKKRYVLETRATAAAATVFKVGIELGLPSVLAKNVFQRQRLVDATDISLVSWCLLRLAASPPLARKHAALGGTESLDVFRSSSVHSSSSRWFIALQNKSRAGISRRCWRRICIFAPKFAKLGIWIFTPKSAKLRIWIFAPKFAKLSFRYVVNLV